MTGPALDWDQPRFSSKEAAVAIGCNTQWLTDLISGSPGKYPLGKDEIIELAQSRRFLFKFRTVFHLSLIRRLQPLLSLEDARDFSWRALDLMFSADLAPGSLARLLSIPPAALPRVDLALYLGIAPGDLAPEAFDRARYLMIVPGSRAASILVREDLTHVHGILNDAADWEPTILLNVTPVFDQVVERLGL